MGFSDYLSTSFNSAYNTVTSYVPKQAPKASEAAANTNTTTSEPTTTQTNTTVNQPNKNTHVVQTQEIASDLGVMNFLSQRYSQAKEVFNGLISEYYGQDSTPAQEPSKTETNTATTTPQNTPSITTPETPSTQATSSLPSPAQTSTTRLRNYSESLSTDGNKELNFGTPSERLTTLDSISQIDRSDITFHDSDRCGPSSLVAGAYYAGGREGLSQLVEAIKTYETSKQTDSDYQMTTGDLEDRLKNNGKVTNQDLSNLQEALYNMLSSNQNSTINSSGAYTGHGISGDIIENFINDSPQVKSMFDKNNMAIALIDNDGDGVGNHFILNFPDENGTQTIYDPYPINTNGKQDQVTQDTEVFKKYRDSVTSVTYSKGN